MNIPQALIPTEEQVKASLRWGVTVFGASIAGWFASKGWFTVDQVEHVLNSPTLAGAAVSLVMWVISMIVHTQSSAVAVVDKMAKDPTSPVAGVITTNTPAGRALSDSIPGTTTVPAGSPAASKIANN